MNLKKIITFLLLLPILLQQLDVNLYFNNTVLIPSISVLLSDIVVTLILSLNKNKLNIVNVTYPIFIFIIIFFVSTIDSYFYPNYLSITKSIGHLSIYIWYASNLCIFIARYSNITMIIEQFVNISKWIIAFGWFQFLIYNIFNLDIHILSRSTSYTSDFIRISSIFNEPSWYGVYININLIFLLFILDKRLKIFILINILSLLSTLSLSSYLIFIVIFLFYMYKTYAMHYTIIGVFLFFLFFLLYIFLNESLYIRLSLIFLDGSDVGGGMARYDSSIGQMKLWLDNNIFMGVGFGNSANYIEKYYIDIFKIDAAELSKRSGDSMLFLILSEIGLFGFFLITIVFKYKIMSIYKYNSKKLLFPILLSIVLLFLTQGFLMEPKIWFLIGLFFSL